MEHVALYRQFRPENFDEIVEQKAAVAALRQSVNTGRIGHAYLFCGQRGTGKTSIARVFARAINCESPINGNPCNNCPTCKGIKDGSLLDVIEIDAASNRSIDNIKKICEEVGYAPSKAKYKVYIIDEVHMITNEAFNALLKTLEEPPAHAVFLFATTEPHSIPATILSRCQRYDFRRISHDSIIGRLRFICEKENIKANDDALKLIASLSDGAMRDAISLLDQAASAAPAEGITDESIEEMTGTVNTAFLADVAEILINGKFDLLLDKCRELSESGRDVIQFSLDLAGYFRNLMVVRVMPDPTNMVTASAAALKRMYEIASTTNSATLVAFVSSLSKLISDLKWSPSVRTSFEIGLLRLCGRKVKAETVPLVIPDFVTKQAEAAAAISQKFAGTATSEPATIPAPAPVAEPVVEPAAEPVAEPVADTPASAPAPAEPTPAESAPVEPVKETKPAEEPEPQPEPTQETAPIQAVESTSAPAPVAPEEEVDEEDKPMENQMDIFSMAMPSSDDSNGGDNIFANLTSSFMDDVVINKEEEPAEPTSEEEEAVPDEYAGLYESTGMIGQTKRTAVSATFDMAGLVQAKPAPKTTEEIWQDITLELSTLDLTGTTLVIDNDCAYIVFDIDSVMLALRSNPDNKKLSTKIKSEFPGVQHVYMYKRAQAEAKGLIAKDTSAVDSFMDMAQSFGINTEIHFGDN